MRILITYPVAEDVLLSILNENVIYRPDLQTKGNRFVTKALTELRPDVLIAQELPDEQAVESWVSETPDSGRFIVQKGNSQQASEAQQFWLAGVPVFITVPDERIHPDIQPLSLAERVHTERLMRVGGVNKRVVSAARQKASVALIGAGIVNLITAYYLTEAGYSIAIYDASPDPRESEHWSRYGCTRGGGDARMFTLTEADNYNDKDFTAIAHFNNLFRSKVSESGWVICDTNNISIPEQTWIHEFEAVPPWLANVYNNDILSFNNESLPLWEDLMENASELFQDVELREGIVRLYSDEAHYRQSIERHRKIQSLRRTLTPEELTEKYPALADAALLNQGMKKISLTSRSFVDTGFYYWHI